MFLAAAATAGAQTIELEKWTRDLASANADVRHEAAANLNRCAADCAAAVPALVTTMQRAEPGDVSEAAFALHQILDDVQTRAEMAGKPAGSGSANGCVAVRPAVRRALNGAAPAAAVDAQFAQTALVKLLGACAEAEDVTTLTAIVSAPAFNVNVRKAASEALARMGPAAAGAIESRCPACPPAPSCSRSTT